MNDFFKVNRKKLYEHKLFLNDFYKVNQKRLYERKLYLNDFGNITGNDDEQNLFLNEFKSERKTQLNENYF